METLHEKAGWKVNANWKRWIAAHIKTTELDRMKSGLKLIQNEADKPVYQAVVSGLKMRIDFIDVYSATFEAPHTVAIESIVKAFFYSIPTGAQGLLAIREHIARQIGLKTAQGKQKVMAEIQSFQGCIGEKIGLFEIWYRNENEIVTGQKDKHLDFTLSFYVEKSKAGHLIQLTTIVQINSFVGKVYFFLVKPMHRLLMPIIMNRLSKKLKNCC